MMDNLDMSDTISLHDPFLGTNVEISNKLTDRLRGKYACGPHLPNGNPEFGWRQFEAPPIQHEAAAYIEQLEAKLNILNFAVKPFVDFGEFALTNGVWNSRVQLEPISTWFGPSDFQELLIQFKKKETL